jgi:hypothetical protein
MSKETDALLHFSFLLIAIVIYFFKKPRRRNTYLVFLGGFLIVTFIADAFGASIMFNKRLANIFKTNLFIYHLLVPCQVAFIMAMYRSLFRNVVIKRALGFLIPGFFIVSLIISLTIQPFDDYNTYAILFKHVLVILVILLFLYEMLQIPEYSNIYREPIFWINTAFLFHAVANIFLEGLSNYLLTNRQASFKLIYMLYSISNYVLFTLIIIGLSINPIDRGEKT